MSYHVFFSFSVGLAKRIRVPLGTMQSLMEHIEEVERVLGLKRTKYLDNPVHWNNFDPEYRNGFPSVTDEVLCETVQHHNHWVRSCYKEFADWSKTPFKSTKGHKGEWITPKDAETFWHGFEQLEVEPSRWTMDYYRDRMDHLYTVMRGQEHEGVTFNAKELTPKQAGAVIGLFETFLDSHDLRLEVPNGCDFLASSYDGGYTWCEKCGPVAEGDEDACRKRKCPIREERESLS